MNTLGEAMRGWMMQRPHDAPGLAPWRAMRPNPQSFGQPRLADIMAQHPGRNWHPAMIMAQRLQGQM